MTTPPWIEGQRFCSDRSFGSTAPTLAVPCSPMPMVTSVSQLAAYQVCSHPGSVCLVDHVLHAKCTDVEAGSDPRGHLWVTWGVYPCVGKPPLADIIPSHPPGLTRCDSVIGLAIPAMSGHVQYPGAAS